MLILFLVILVGDAGVGKTCLLSMYRTKQIPKTVRPTIGVTFSIKDVTLKDKTVVKAQIWDCSG